MNILLFAMMILTASAAEDRPKFKAAWKKCEKSADCLPAKGACGWDASNKNFKAEFEEFQLKISPLVECLGIPNYDKIPEVECAKSACQVKAAKK